MHLQSGALDVSQDPFGKGHEYLAGWRKRHVAPGSVEQLAA
jgi:hypothetical protein